MHASLLTFHLRALGTVLAAAVLPACAPAEPALPPPLPLVRTAVAVPAGTTGLELRAVVASRARLRLAFKDPGVVASIGVREGERVHPGQLLATLDDVDATAQERTARAALERAERDAERAARLAAAGALAPSLSDDARNQLETCQAQWQQATDTLKRTHLVAAVTGTVYQRLAEPGETVGAGAPVLVIDTTDRLVVRAAVAERDLERVSLGQPATLRREANGLARSARVTSIGASPTAADGLYPVELTPDAASGPALRPGELLAVRLDGGEEREGMRIPLDALVHRQDRDLLFVVEPRAEGVRVQLRVVLIGRAEGSSVVIRSGLEPGERVVAEGAYFLQDGAAVRLAE